MWVKFIKEFAWKPSSQVTVLYREGLITNVKADVGANAIAKGAATRMYKKNKNEDPTEDD